MRVQQKIIDKGVDNNKIIVHPFLEPVVILTLNLNTYIMSLRQLIYLFWSFRARSNLKSVDVIL